MNQLAFHRSFADGRRMPQIELRVQPRVRSPDDVIATVQDKTFDYLMTSDAPGIRISAYLDRDWPRVEAMYTEVFVDESCPFESKITKIMVGSRTRKNISLPGPMKKGEQLTILVTRTRRV